MEIDPRLFLPPAAVAEAVAAAAANRQPFALIRIGDGEALTLAQGTVRPWSYVAAKTFLRQAGVIVPDLSAREKVAFAVRHAEVVGVPARRDLPDFAPLTEEVFRHFGLAPRRLCDCCINYALQQAGLLVPLLRGRRLFLVNRRWPLWAEALTRLYGLKVVGGAGIDHFGEVEKVLAVSARHHFDMALCAAGVPATWLAVMLSRRHRCVALDLGRLADLMIELAGREKGRPLERN